MHLDPSPSSRNEGSAAAFASRLALQYGLDDVPWSSSGSRASLGMATVRYDLPHLFVLPPLPAEDAFVIGVELSAAGGRRNFQGRTQTLVAPAQPGAIHIVDLADQPVAYVCSPFHSVLFHINRASIDEFAADTGVSMVTALRCPSGVDDPVIASLARAMLPSIARPGEACPLFLDHVALALYAHLATHYGDGRPRDRAKHSTGLAPWQQRRAKDLLLGQIARNVSLAEVAGECRLSRSHFGKAFKQSTGETPHAWLTARRIEAVQRMLLESSASLSEIALACGFADQSHLTRVFGARVGQSPAHWRRMHLN
jgi:AraC family transcriptional regulator